MKFSLSRMKFAATFRYFGVLALLLSLFIGLVVTPAISETIRKNSNEFKASLSAPVSRAVPPQLNPPVVDLDGGSKLTILSPQRWTNLAEQVRASLTATHYQYTKYFGEIPPFVTSIRLMEDEEFYATTGAPRWTNALYYKNQIIIPLSTKENVDSDNLYRSVKHEYTHAVIHALSNGRAPGWLDEGLAQWAEGIENPALQPALANWLFSHEPVPFSLLQNGFTRLHSSMVPAAYAQSLFAANSAIQYYGFHSIGEYFENLRFGEDRAQAFKSAFGVTEEAFEKQMRGGLISWAKTRNGK